MAHGNHVAILLATRNGARFLREQLDSIAAQTHEDWSLHVSDDGSRDPTLRIVADFARDHPGRRIAWRRGPERGSTANFLSLVADRRIAGDYFALVDQDDVWLPGKLERALEKLGPLSHEPTLYGSRTYVACPDLTIAGVSPLPHRAPCFRNALVQSYAGGNTMVLNAAARTIAQRAGVTEGVACHDWWLYQIVSGAGGQIVYDPVPTLLYRQHGANQIGANLGPRATARRLAGLMHGRYADWNDANVRALADAEWLLTAENRAQLRNFRALRQTRGFGALVRLRRSGLFRQSLAGNLSLALAVAAGRV